MRKETVGIDIIITSRNGDGIPHEIADCNKEFVIPSEMKLWTDLSEIVYDVSIMSASILKLSYNETKFFMVNSPNISSYNF